MKSNQPHIIDSVSELHQLLNIKKPTHPFISVVNLEDISLNVAEEIKTMVYNFYSVYLKKNCDGKVKYGQQYYDFDDGIMTFLSPKQLLSIEANSSSKVEGWMIVFHPDFIQSYSLAKRIKEYGFFSYANNEALHLSEKEEVMISGMIQNLQQEIKASIDHYTQDVIVSHLDLLLNYSNRFYNRQFITRKKVSSDLLVKFEVILNAYYQNDDLSQSGLPSVQYFADKLFISPHYLNDMLKKLTGQTTQQHVQNQLLEKAKELLSTTELSISEMAYLLGFEYPQSFNKLFKKKIQLTPLEFRQSFN